MTKWIEREVSTRLIRPTWPEFDLAQILNAADKWTKEMDWTANVTVFDEGISQYMLVDEHSHHQFFAALLLSKPSLRCRVLRDEESEPEDSLETADNIFSVKGVPDGVDEHRVAGLMQTLAKRGYRFDRTF